MNKLEYQAFFLERYQDAGIPNKFLNASLKSFPDSDCYRELLFESESRTLYLTGGEGRGKTYFACAMMRDYIQRFYKENSATRYPSALYTSLSRITTDIRETFEHGGSTERELLAYYMEKNLLIIDDLGQDRQSDFTRNTLFNICDYRLNHQSPTIYITLRSVDDMRNELFSPEIVSRICHNVIQFKGRDRRQNDSKILEVTG